MAEDIDSSVSYLRTLKQSSGPHNGTAAAPAHVASPQSHPWPEGTGTDANSGDQFPGPEKRLSTRYRCEGSAGMREDGVDVQTWARFTDISLHGCYVEAQATYPVGTVLHLKLEANGMRVDNKGTVRVSYPYLGMGIAFTDVSEETREHMKEMMGSLSRPAAITGLAIEDLEIVSSLPARELPHTLPKIADHATALQALTEFFDSRQMLTREKLPQDPSQEPRPGRQKITAARMGSAAVPGGCRGGALPPQHAQASCRSY